MSEVGKFILQRLNTLNLTQVEAAEKGGFTRQSIGNWVNGNVKSIRLDNVVSLALVLEVAPYYLLQRICREIDVNLASPAISRYEGDHSSFVRDTNFPDNSVVQVYDKFTKSWAIQNTGTTPWNNRWLSCQDLPSGNLSDKRLGFLMPAENKVPIMPTEPGEIVEIQVEFTAPGLPGTIRSTWLITDEEGNVCFPHHTGVWCQVRVISI